MADAFNATNRMSHVAADVGLAEHRFARRRLPSVAAAQDVVGSGVSVIVPVSAVLLATLLAGTPSAAPVPAAAPAAAPGPAAAAAASSSAAPRFLRPRLLVWGFVPDGVEPAVATTIAAAVTRWAGRNTHVETIGAAELKNLSAVEAARQAVGLPDSGRLEAIARAVDASLVLFGQVARDGDAQIVSLQLFQAREARAIMRERAVVTDLTRAEEFLGRAANVLVGRVLDQPAPDETTAARTLVQALPGTLFATTVVQPASTTPFVVADSATTAPFGEQFARGLDAAIRTRVGANGGLRPGVTLRGSFRENADMIELAVVADDPAAVAAPPAHAQIRMVRYVVEPSTLAPTLTGEARRAAEARAAGGATSLRLDAWTEKGRFDVAFVEGETFHVYLKMNQPGFVRLLYHLVDGTPVLMEDAWPVPAERVGSVLRYEQDFGPAAPFGVERIEAIAFTRRPSPLPTRRQVIDGNPFDVVLTASQRGFVVAPESKVEIEITTSPR